MTDATVTSEASLRAQLDAVDAAILAALSGSSYSLGGRSVTRQDLPSLRDERTRIIRDLRTLNAVVNGASSPGEAVATWYR